jgi:hypothetical protein
MLFVSSFTEMPDLLHRKVKRQLPGLNLYKYTFYFFLILLVKTLCALFIIYYISITHAEIFTIIFDNVVIDKFEWLEGYKDYLISLAAFLLIASFFLEYKIAKNFYFEFCDRLQVYLINKKFDKFYPRTIMQFSRSSGQYMFYGLRDELELLVAIGIVIICGGISIGLALYAGQSLTSYSQLFAAYGLVFLFLGFCLSQSSNVAPIEIENKKVIPPLVDIDNINDNNDPNNINYYQELCITFLIVFFAAIKTYKKYEQYNQLICVLLSLIMTYFCAKSIEMPRKSHAFFNRLKSIDDCSWGVDDPEDQGFEITIKGTIFGEYEDTVFEDFDIKKRFKSFGFYKFRELSDSQFKELASLLTGEHGASKLVKINGEAISKEHLDYLRFLSMTKKINKNNTIWQNMLEIDPDLTESRLASLMDQLCYKADPNSFPKFGSTGDKYIYCLLELYVSVGSCNLVVIDKTITTKMTKRHWQEIKKIQKQSGCIIIVN